MHQNAQGLSLSELLVALLIITVLGLIAVPQYGVASVDREAVAAADIVHEVQAKVIAYKQARGYYPNEIQAEWFPLGKMISPYRPEVQQVQVRRGGFGEAEPDNVRLSGNTAYWYNEETGAFRALVPDQGNPESTRRLFQKINR